MSTSFLCFAILSAVSISGNGQSTVNGRPATPCEKKCMDSPDFPFNKHVYNACFSKCTSSGSIGTTPQETLTDTLQDIPQATSTEYSGGQVYGHGNKVSNQVGNNMTDSGIINGNHQSSVNGHPATPCEKQCLESPDFPFNTQATNACLSKCPSSGSVTKK